MSQINSNNSGHDKRFDHDRSNYERPVNPHRCEHATLWGKPCWQGPEADGHCGGSSQCQPVFKNSRWECRRPKEAGGRCDQGPLPDGKCAHTRPPCTPRPALRQWRSRFTLTAAIATLALLVLAYGINNGPTGSNLAIDPGELSGAHTGFTTEQGCSSCHDNHDSATQQANWLTAVFKDNDTSEKCVSCHSFEGPEFGIHNAVHEDTGEADKPLPEHVSCTACHTEHKGNQTLDKNIEQTCGQCHEQHFRDFATGHPEFADNYPYQKSPAIYFDHASHIGEYFSDEQWTGKAAVDADFAAIAKDSCIACHDVATTSREVKPRPYEQVCGQCHDQQIRKNEMILLSSDSISAIGSVLFGMDMEETEDEQMEELWLESAQELAENGATPLIERLDSLLPERGANAATAQTLLRGINPIELQTAAALWQEDEAMEQDLEERMTQGSWISGEDADSNQALFYRPEGHADPVIKAWIELLLDLRKMPSDSEPDVQELASVALTQILDPESGPGVCGKCHSAGLLDTGAAGYTSWTYSGTTEREHTGYAHAPHLQLVDTESGCINCHVMDPEADYAAWFQNDRAEDARFSSNFSRMEKQTCVQCHQAGKVKADCQLCHDYHRSPGFKTQFKQQGLPYEKD